MLGFDIVLDKARKGNQESLMRLYDLCCDAVFNASHRIVLNVQDAEEITQDAVLKAFANLDGFKGSERDFVALVKTIAINKSIDMFRKHSSRFTRKLTIPPTKSRTMTRILKISL